MDEDEASAWAYQAELECRQQEEEALARCRKLTAELREETTDFERACKAHDRRFTELTRGLFPPTKRT